jgi:hypothetical protein
VRNGVLRDCEQFVLPDQVWQDLPRMLDPRCDFNPCQYHCLLYLCGCGSGIMEAFDTVTSVFLPIPTILPEEYRACCVFEENNQLVVISSTHVTRWNSGPQGLMQLSHTQHSEYETFCNMTPLVNLAKRKLYISFNKSLYSIPFDGRGRTTVAT